MQFVKISKIEKINKKANLYNFACEPNNNYFANNVLVHNCYRMEKGFRPRSPSSILAEIEWLKKTYCINAIWFIDELLMVNKERITSICSMFINTPLKIKWSCNGRLNFATPEIVSMMKKAGCVFINYGIECFDDNILKVMNKHLTTEQIVKGVEATQKVGINCGLNLMYGNIGENRETLRKTTEFLLKYNKTFEIRSIRPLQPYPGAPLYYYAIEKGLLKDVDEFYKKHINSDLLSVNFTELSDEEYYHALKESNLRIIEDYYEKSKNEMFKKTCDLYDNKNLLFRGFRQH